MSSLLWPRILVRMRILVRIVGPADEAPSLDLSALSALLGVPLIDGHIEAPYRYDVLVFSPTALAPTSHHQTRVLLGPRHGPRHRDSSFPNISTGTVGLNRRQQQITSSR